MTIQEDSLMRFEKARDAFNHASLFHAKLSELYQRSAARENTDSTTAIHTRWLTAWIPPEPQRLPGSPPGTGRRIAAAGICREWAWGCPLKD